MLRDKTAFLFAGQGAQVAGMGMEFAEHKDVKVLYEMAEEMRPGIINLMKSGTAQELGQTINTQPCMYLADLASAIVRGEYYPPAAVCGFSVGEIPALAYAGAFSYSVGFKIILERARLMEEASQTNKGTMVAVIGLDGDAVQRIAAQMPCAYAANFNSISQTVVATSLDSVEPLRAAVLTAGGRAVRLAVSGAFHCPLMAEASNSFLQFLRKIEFNQPKMPVYANLTAQRYEGDMAQTLASQMAKPVQFYKTILNLVEKEGITDFEEQGPGNVLTKLTNGILNINTAK